MLVSFLLPCSRLHATLQVLLESCHFFGLLVLSSPLHLVAFREPSLVLAQRLENGTRNLRGASPMPYQGIIQLITGECILWMILWTKLCHHCKVSPLLRWESLCNSPVLVPIRRAADLQMQCACRHVLWFGKGLVRRC